MELFTVPIHIYIVHEIRVITKLPNSEQSYKGKVKTHNYINRQNQSTTGKLWKRNDPDLVQAFLKKTMWVNIWENGVSEHNIKRWKRKWHVMFVRLDVYIFITITDVFKSQNEKNPHMCYPVRMKIQNRSWSRE
jgi:hypothetical protein